MNKDDADFNVAVIGGDGRQRLVADELKKRGYRVSEFAVDGDDPAADDVCFALSGARLAVLPLPASRDGFRVNARADIPFWDLVQALPVGCRVFAGRLQPALKDLLRARRVAFFDFYQDEIFERENTVISADGAVAELLRRLDGDLSGKGILVCGYGNFGRALCERLKSLGAEVTVAARRDASLDEARHNGVSALKIDLGRGAFFHVPEEVCAVMNTIPYHIFTEHNLATLKGKIYLELASAPFGGEASVLKAASDYTYLPSIPAKFAPARAGKAMLDSLLRYIERSCLSDEG